MKFSLFRKQKQQNETENPAEPPQEEPKQEATPPEEPAPTEAAPMQETVASVSESKTYLKAMPLKDVADVENVKNEIKNGNIIILRVTPLANKSIDDVKNAVNELYQFSESIGGDIARLGEERVVICPKNIGFGGKKRRLLMSLCLQQPESF